MPRARNPTLATPIRSSIAASKLPHTYGNEGAWPNVAPTTRKPMTEFEAKSLRAQLVSIASSFATAAFASIVALWVAEKSSKSEPPPPVQFVSQNGMPRLRYEGKVYELVIPQPKPPLPSPEPLAFHLLPTLGALLVVSALIASILALTYSIRRRRRLDRSIVNG